MKKRIILVVLLGVGVIGIVTYLLTRNQRGQDHFISVSGNIEATEVEVGFKISGRIVNRPFEEGAWVEKGQILGKLDDEDLRNRLEVARATLVSARARLDKLLAGSRPEEIRQAEASLQQARFDMNNKQLTYERMRMLHEKQVIPKESFDNAETAFKVAKAAFQRANEYYQLVKEGPRKEDIDDAKAQVEQAKASLKVAETNLRYTTIRSPVNGTVISRNVDVGQTVAASLQAPTLFTIAKDLTQMQVDTNVSEADVGRITAGQDATFTVDAYPERVFHGKVSEIRNAPIIVQNVVTYDVVILVDNRDLKLKPGMTANVSVMISHREGVLKIPNAALRFRPDSAKQEGFPEKKGESSTSTARLLIERLTRELNLTSDQQSKLEMVLRSSRQEFKEISEKIKPEEARVRIQGLIRQKIGGILTDEQKRKLEEMSQSPQAEQRKLGRVWILSKERKPVAVSVVLGITDGTFSEVMAGDLREGMEVIVEEISNKKGSTQSSTPTFMGGPRR